MPTSKQLTVFSGVQPTGNFHLGNYLGALTQWLDLQHKYQCIFCVVDYHAITVAQNPKNLHRQILDIAKIYLASGINPKRALIFRQSDIPEHTELAWILNCIANAGELKRMTQFNFKSGIQSLDQQIDRLESFFELRAQKNVSDIIGKLEQKARTYNTLTIDYVIKEMLPIITKHTGEYYAESTAKLLKSIEDENKKFNSTTVGLFDYPVLMASDILLYNTNIVPVGHDQLQHIELARDLAKRFNSRFGQTFTIPEAKIHKEGARIMGLDDPTKKMSKSAASPANYIALLDSPATAKKKIMRAVTDSGSEVKYDVKNKPAIANLLTIYSLLANKSIKELESQYAGKGYGDFKKDLAEVVSKFLTDFQIKFHNISDRQVAKIFNQSAKKLQPQAAATLDRVKKNLGL